MRDAIIGLTAFCAIGAFVITMGVGCLTLSGSVHRASNDRKIEQLKNRVLILEQKLEEKGT